MPLEIRVEAGQPQKVFLNGSIDETSDISKLFSQLSGPVLIDLTGIKKINSIGIHRWIPLITDYSKNNRVEIKALSYAMAIQANAIVNLFGTASVKSVLSPFSCSKCDTDCMVEITSKQILDCNPDTPVAHCPTCSSTMNFDELPEYFDFIRDTVKQ